MTSPLIRGGLAGVLLLAGAVRLDAQQWCDASIPHQSYDACGLHLWGNELAQGDRRAIIAVTDAFSPLPLHRYIAGDSALKHAWRYERIARGAGAMRFLAGTLAIVSSVKVLSKPVNPAIPGEHISPVTLRWIGAASASYLVSIPIQWRANREAEKAVALHNAALAR